MSRTSRSYASRRLRAFVPDEVESLDQRQLPSSGLANPVPADSRVIEQLSPDRANLGERVIKNITYTHHGRRVEKLDLYLPVGQAPEGGWPIILAFPGGGWRWASRADYGGRVSVFTHLGYAVAGVDYTYASSSGGHTWPANLQDARAAVGWVHRNADKFNLDTSKIVAMGESAGAHIALLLGTYPPTKVISGVPNTNAPVDPKQAAATHIAAVVDFYGPTDLTALYNESRASVIPYFTTFLGGPPSQYPDRYTAASPITYVNANTPPIFIAQGLDDPTVLPSQSYELDSALTKAGVPHTLVTISWAAHGFPFQLGNVNLVPAIKQFLNGALNGTPLPPSQQIG